MMKLIASTAMIPFEMMQQMNSGLSDEHSTSTEVNLHGSLQGSLPQQMVALLLLRRTQRRRMVRQPCFS